MGSNEQLNKLYLNRIQELLLLKLRKKHRSSAMYCIYEKHKATKSMKPRQDSADNLYRRYINFQYAWAIAVIP